MAPADRDQLLRFAERIADEMPIDCNDSGVLDDSSGIRQLAAAVSAFRHASPPAGPSVEQEQPLFRWGDLEVKAQLGEGAFAQVYRAWDPALDREVALKLQRSETRPGMSGSLDEARRLARVRHPHVLTVHGADVRDGRIGIWTELIDGQTLEERLASEGPVGPTEAVAIGTELCSALAAIHGAGLIHGDVKASNVIRERGGRIVLADLGAATETGSGPATTGSPLSTAPEVLRGEQPTAASDLYSLGALLFRLLAGTAPVVADRAADLVARPVRRSLRDLRPDLPAGLVQSVERTLAEVPDDRFASAGEMEQALRTALAEPTQSGAPRPTSKVPLWPVMAAALLVVISVAILLVIRAQPQSADAATQPPVASSTATLIRTRDGQRTPLATGASVRPGDQLHLKLELPGAHHIYVLNEDLNGALFVLFPLAGLEQPNPLPAGTHRLPGRKDGVPLDWQVTTAGGREKFLVIASVEPLGELERTLQELQAAGSGGSASMVVRGVGGLAPASSQPISLAAIQQQLEAQGPASLWLERFELDNPG